MLQSLHDFLSPYYWQWNIYTFLKIFLFSVLWVYFGSLFDGPIKADRVSKAKPSEILKDRMEYQAKLFILWCTSVFYILFYALIFGLIEKYYHNNAVEIIDRINGGGSYGTYTKNINFNWFNPISWDPEWWFNTTLVFFGLFFSVKEVKTILNQRQFWIDLWNNPYQSRATSEHSDYTYPSEAIVKVFGTMGLGVAIVIYIIFSAWGLMFHLIGFGAR
jgi:hypothetical protein